jgi:uncharacterized membrane protein YgcG
VSVLRFCIAALAAWALAFAAPAQERGFGPGAADLTFVERVLSWDADITVNKDGTIDIRETIRLNARNRLFNLGFIRDLPTRYTKPGGGTLNVDFEVVSVTRNGKPEPYEVKREVGLLAIFVGPESYPPLTPGEHTYVVHYRAFDQILFNDDGDELFWNVTPSDLQVLIEKASVTVRGPGNTPPAGVEAAAGMQGGMVSTGENVRITRPDPGTVVATTMIPVSSSDQLTISVWWPKGTVDAPPAAKRVWLWIKDWISAVAGALGLAMTALMNLLIWNRVGRDPPRGTIIPLFTPPKGFSPGDARYLRELSGDNKIFAATLVNMAVKGAIVINEDAGWLSKTFTLKPGPKGEAVLDGDERALYGRLLGARDKIELKQENWKTIQAAAQGLDTTMTARHEPKHFVSNTGWSMLTFLPIVLGVLGTFFLQNGNDIALIAGIVLAVAAAVFAISFVHLMKRPSAEGQKLRDEIDGFRMFLDTAEKERWEILNPPDMTPELFEKYLPYALALDVDHTWSETFEREIRIREGADYHYRPSWYTGRNFSGVGANGLAGSLSNALTSATAASRMAPGSKGGSSGGGRIGGGFGGGGFRGR